MKPDQLADSNVEVAENLPDPKSELLEAEAECDRLIEEVKAYDWEYGPYPVGLALPYSTEDIDFFHGRAYDAENLKTRILALLARLGSSGQHWREQIRATTFSEVYITDALAYGAKRPKESALIAAREILETARASLIDTAQDLTLSRGEGSRSLGSPQAVRACREYMRSKILTPDEFAKRCGTSDRTVRNFFSTKKVRASIFQAIAEEMDLTAEQLLRGEWPPLHKVS